MYPSCGRVVWRMGERGYGVIFESSLSPSHNIINAKSAVLSELYGRLNLNLVRANMRADIVLKIISELLFSFGHVFVCFLCPIIVSCIINNNNNNNNIGIYKHRNTYTYTTLNGPNHNLNIHKNKELTTLHYTQMP